MKPDIIKSKTDPHKYLVVLVLIAFLFSLNIIGLTGKVYGAFDYIFGPFIVIIRNSGITFNLFLNEVQNRPFLAQENLELKKRLAQYDGILVENQILMNQIKSIESENNIKAGKSPPLIAVQVSGVQNLYSSNPRLRILIPRGVSVKKWDPVYFDRLILIGFITEISGNTAIVSPFYSSNLTEFNIPVQSLNHPDLKGFVNRMNKGEITIRNIPKDSSVSTGDIWITTNDVFEVPPGLIVGKVKSVREDTSTGFKEVELSLMFDLSTTNYVYLRNE